MAKPDILVFMSDQHTSYFTGYFGQNVDTPNLDRLAAEGTRFDHTYTPCPLCVPARMAMMSTLQAYRTGIYTNDDTLPDLQPTFLHPLVEAGYETVLCGRMHFVGADQRHGFTKRIAPDTTRVSWTRPVKKLQEQRGVLVRTFADVGAVQVVGGGESPVIYYDQVVVQSALDYLKEDHEKPQFILVGTYGPHFPYITRPELFEKYMNRVEASKLLQELPDYMNEVLLRRRRIVSEEVAKGCVAAYCGLIEQMDEQIGQVRQAFEAFTKRRGTEQVFCYLSDHGDQVGDRSLFGKDAFFEKSIKVPMLFAGDGIAKGHIVKSPSSILDLGPTLWGLAGTKKLPQTDGVDLGEYLHGKQEIDEKRVIFSELLDGFRAMGDTYHYGRMVVKGNYKYISYDGYEKQDMLFDIENDPDEMQNRIEEEPELADALRKELMERTDPKEILRTQAVHDQRADWMRAVEAATVIDDSERWQENPPTARGQLAVGVTEPLEADAPLPWGKPKG